MKLNHDSMRGVTAPASPRAPYGLRYLVVMCFIRQLHDHGSMTCFGDYPFYAFELKIYTFLCDGFAYGRRSYIFAYLIHFDWLPQVRGSDY